MRAFLSLILVLALGHAAAASPLTLKPAQLAQLGTLPAGTAMVVGGFPDGLGGSANLRFERINVYAPGARVIAVDAAGEHDLPRSARIHLIGVSASGDVRASLAFDPGFTHVAGVGSNSTGTFVISASTDANGATLRAVPSNETLPAGIVPAIVPGNDSVPSGHAMPSALAITLAGASPASTPRIATVAVDTDNELMSTRFANNAANATNWIADLFAAMNVMYQRDLNVTLLQGTTYLRTAPDPYTVTDTPADQNNLSEFGNYWQAHYAGVPRSFAMLLSGKAPNGNQASGIAWVNAYCSTQYGYSVTQVFTDPQISVSYSTLIVGHELGHNFGASHTHCTDASTGNAPTGSNTIDKCYSGESGCYSGPTSCPASGPGAPAGTVMSYCSNIGCGSPPQNVLRFHPAQIGVLSALVAQNTPSCLAVSNDEIFKNGFD
jgi:hypothetical protein